ncbi:MAG: NTP transferase domain-containing protein [Acidimicrobiales bacterium]
MQLVVMAAGHGRRFGGLKQLAPVGPNDEALMDYTAKDALAAGFDHVVLIVREEIRAEILDHVSAYWPPELQVSALIQGPVAGTAQAVATAEPVIEGSFGVANADDLYGTQAMRMLADQVQSLGPDEHLIVGYRLDGTVLTDAPVTRGVCATGPDGYLRAVREQTVQRRAGGGGFTGRVLRESATQETDELSGAEVVSMNLWGFSEGIFDDIGRALGVFDAKRAPGEGGKPPELLLPEVVGHLVAAELARVRVVQTEGRCVGLTHPDDIPLVRELILATRH